MRIVVLQNNQQTEITLNKETSILGRGREADIRIRDQGISRRHLSLTLEDKKLRVVDLGSRNGFFVRGKKVPECLVEHNEEFSIGDISFVFQTHEDALPQANLPLNDATPLDAEFVTNEEDQKLIPLEPKESQAPITAVPVRTAAKHQPSLLKNKKLVWIGGICIFLITVSLLSLLQESDKPKPPKISIPQSTTGNVTYEDYQRSCEAVVNIFSSYFNDPSRYRSDLDKSFEALKIPLAMKKFQRLKTAQEIFSILSIFKDVGHQWDKFNDIQLSQIQTSCQTIEASRNVTPTLLTFSRKTATWAESQLGAWNFFDEIRQQTATDSLDNNLLIWGKLNSYETDHIYTSTQESLKKSLAEKIGKQYMARALENFDKHDQDNAVIDDLNRASQFGLGTEAQKLIGEFAINKLDQDLIQKAQESFENDNLNEALDFLNQTSQESRWQIQISNLKKQVRLRQLLISLRQAYVRGQPEEFNSILEISDLNNEPKVQKMVQETKNIFSAYNQAREALSKENYSQVKKACQSILNLVPRFDKNNFYRIEAQRFLSAIAPEKISKKHYQRGVKAMEQKRPNYELAREEFDIAQKYDPSIAQLEIDILIRRAQEFVTAHYKAKQNQDLETLEEVRRNLREAKTWLRPNQSRRETTLYKSIQNLLNSN